MDVRTLADQIGAICEALMPIFRLVEGHTFAAERLHGDDTTVPVRAKGKTITGRLWNYVRDDRPFGGNDPPSVIFRYSRDRRGDHPKRHLAAWSGILQADAYVGYNELYGPNREPGPILEAGCFAHARRKFFELADVLARIADHPISRLDGLLPWNRRSAALKPEPGSHSMQSCNIALHPN